MKFLGFLTAFLSHGGDDCDRKVVEAKLATMVRTSAEVRKRDLFHILLDWWPDESRWLLSHPSSTCCYQHRNAD